MQYNKFRFKDFNEFQAVQNLAIANGIATTIEFNQLLDANYSNLKQNSK